MGKVLSTGLASASNIVRTKGFQWFLVIAVTLTFVYVIYRTGVKNGGFQKPKALPDGGNGLPQGWNYQKLVDELWENLDGTYLDFTSWNDYRASLMLVLLNLTKDQLTAVYNQYNYQYGNADGKKSLTAKIKGEWFLQYQEKTLEKFREYGLS